MSLFGSTRARFEGLGADGNCSAGGLPLADTVRLFKRWRSGAERSPVGLTGAALLSCRIGSLVEVGRKVER